MMGKFSNIGLYTAKIRNKDSIEFVIFGICPSKANKYRVGRGGRFYVAPDVVAYANSFAMQVAKVPKHHFGVKDDLAVCYTSYVANMGQDCDNIEKTIQDCLQKTGIIHNDNKIIYHEHYKARDTVNPRVEIMISRLNQ